MKKSSEQYQKLYNAYSDAQLESTFPELSENLSTMYANSMVNHCENFTTGITDTLMLKESKAFLTMHELLTQMNKVEK